MSKKVVQTILNLKDNMSAGLLKVAKNTGKVTKEQERATKQVLAFGRATKKTVTQATKWGTAVAGAATTAFLAMDNLTREYRTAQGKLNTAYEAAGYSAQTATQAYNEFYKILGDTDTATEASQLLAKLVQNQKDVSKWTRIAAGVNGTFGDSLPIEGFIEATNETAKVGKVTGVLADALNWVGISEDAMNAKLSALGTEEERNALLMQTLSGAYDEAADSFYRNNAEMVRTRQTEAQLTATLAKLGSASAGARNLVAQLFGVQSDGGVRAGSALAWFNEKLDGALKKFQELQSSGAVDVWAQKLDGVVIPALNAGATALSWVIDHGELLTRIILGTGAALGTLKLIKIAGDIMSLTKAASGFFSVLKLAAVGNPAMLVAMGVAAAVGLIIANWDKISPVVQGVWSEVQWFAGRVVIVVSGAVDTVKNTVGAVFNWFKEKWEWFTGLLDGFDEKVSGIPILGTLYKYSPVGMAVGAATKNVGRNAAGTSYWRGGPTRINERGGEIVDLPSGTRIIPHDISRQMTGGGVTVYVTVQGNVIGNAEYANSLGAIIAKKILGALDNV